MGKLIAQIVLAVVALAEFGLLKQATLFMDKLAVDAHKRGYVSIREFNERLIDGK